MPQKLFSILIGCYGDHADISLRAVKSIISENSEKERDYDIHVAASACSQETVDELRLLLDNGDIDNFMEVFSHCPENESHTTGFGCQQVAIA